MGMGSNRQAWEQQVMGQWEDERLERQLNDPEARAVARNVTTELIRQARWYVSNVLFLPGQDKKKVLKNVVTGVNATLHNTLFKLANDQNTIRKDGMSVQVDLAPPPMLQEQFVGPRTVPGDRVAFGGIVISVDDSGKAMVLDPHAEPLPTLAIRVACRLVKPVILDDRLTIEFSIDPQAGR